MNKNLTEIVFVIDMSGSMNHLTDDTIGGFNALIEKQKKEEGQCLVNTVLFNDCATVIHDRVDLADVKEMTRKEYCANGSTALIDALGGAIKHISDVHKYIREEDVPEKTMFIITTDGMENASYRYTSDEVKKMVEKKKEEGWEFLFLGANIDAVETARNYGISEDRAVKYYYSKRGVETNYAECSEAIGRFRRDKKIDADWKKKIEELYKEGEK